MIINTALKQKQLKGSIQPFNLPKYKTCISSSYFCWFKAAYNLKIIYCIILSSRMFISPLLSFWDTFPFVQGVLFGSPSICQISPGIRTTVYVHTACSEISSGFFFFNYLFSFSLHSRLVFEKQPENITGVHGAKEQTTWQMMTLMSQYCMNVRKGSKRWLLILWMVWLFLSGWFSLCNKTIGPAL